MDSLILRTGVRLLLPLMLLFSIFILWRGHNEPGGGFVGGLICAVGFALHALAFGVRAMRLLLKVDPRTVLGAGLLVGILPGFVGGLLSGAPYMTSQWLGAVGTPLLFDIGVYLVVVGAILTMVETLMEEGED
ncbi:Na(+)/H(+) antiporter subunit B [Niveispirillum lacus]|uniref:Na(+)/H(+) antiporter subunit B n=2 Tax=Niveispirillum lacus TaxID=1981099 RepID=A0A255YYM1_9PROT|nr:Na(+)/H(+) antiporter subunit B [Niveispirillum lacus]